MSAKVAERVVVWYSIILNMVLVLAEVELSVEICLYTFVLRFRLDV